MTEKEILERLKEIVNEAHFYAIKLGNVIGLLDLLIDDIYSSIERKETDKK